jgi:hypothetical protein
MNEDAGLANALKVWTALVKIGKIGDVAKNGFNNLWTGQEDSQ